MKYIDNSPFLDSLNEGPKPAKPTALIAGVIILAAIVIAQQLNMRKLTKDRNLLSLQLAESKLNQSTDITEADAVDQSASKELA